MKKQILCIMSVLVVMIGSRTLAATSKGSFSVMPAYYDHNLLTIQFVEFPSSAESMLLQHNQSLNFIYQSDPGLAGGAPFISVIDAIPTDGFNPVWQEVQIAFNAGFAPRQLFSDDEVLAAAMDGEISLTFTDEVYWCPVVGHN